MEEIEASMSDERNEIRERFELAGLSRTLEAFAVYWEGERPVDRKGRFKPRVVEINARRPLEDFSPSPGIGRDELIWFLRSRVRKAQGIRSKWGDRAQELVFALAECGGLIVKADLDAKFQIKHIPQVWLTPYWEEVAEEKLAELTGRIAPGLRRAALLALLAEVPDLSTEYRLLAAQDPDDPLVPPLDSSTRALRWQPYEFALRIAVWWHSRTDPERKPSMDEATASAFPDGKASKEEWTEPRRRAVENLLADSLSELMEAPDYDIRVRGPLTWRIGSVAVDASVARPWAGLPSNSARLVGEIVYPKAAGVFIVENQSTFQQVCRLGAVTDAWIVVWGKGYAPHGLIELLRKIGCLPIAVWGDLDADGINIVCDMQERLGRPFHPVGMDAAYWLEGDYRHTSPEQNARSVKLAKDLLEAGAGAFQDLAIAIATDPESAGRSREQQTLHDRVLALLPELLTAVAEKG